MTGMMWFATTNEMISPELFILVFGGALLFVLIGALISYLYKPEDDEEK